MVNDPVADLTIASEGCSDTNGEGCQKGVPGGISLVHQCESEYEGGDKLAALVAVDAHRRPDRSAEHGSILGALLYSHVVKFGRFFQFLAGISTFIGGVCSRFAI